MTEPRLLNKICKWAAISVAVLCVLALLAPFGVVPFVFMQHLLFGGLAHLWASAPHMIPSLHLLVGFAVLLMVSICSLQALLDRFGKSKHGPEFRWQRKWTLSFVGLMLAAFGTACTTIGLAHHGAWLMRGDVIYFDSGRSPISRSMSNGRRLITSLKIYSSDRGGKYPKTLEGLVGEDGLTREEFVRFNRMIGPDGMPYSWIYLPGLSDSDPGNIPVIVGMLPFKAGHVVGSNDSSVTIMKRAEYEEAMARYRQHVGEQPPK